jgi:signal transduction histidine kinase
MFLVQLYQKSVAYITAPQNGVPASHDFVRSVQNHTLATLTTSALMWAYAVLAILTIHHPLPGIVGVVASLVHMLSPFLFRLTRNVLLVASIMLFAGMCHQGTFAYFTGGFESNILIWFGVLPFLAALIAGRRGAILWTSITVAVSLVFMVLEFTGHLFPDVISGPGRVTAQALIVFGWIFLSGTLSFIYLFQEERIRHRQNEQKKRIENLFRVLCHDLGNPLALVQMALEQVQGQEDNAKRERSLEISQRAVSSMMDITQNVRRMYAVQEGKVEVHCVPMALNSAIEQLEFLFQTPLGHKTIRLDYDKIKNLTTVVLVDPVSFVHQVLGNIVSNAIKFSERGGVISISTAPGPLGYIHIHIKDQGVGMPKFIATELFNVEAKTTRPGTEGERGTGFGMHLMKTFVEKYGGHVQVESVEKAQAPSHGTTFTLILKGHIA